MTDLTYNDFRDMILAPFKAVWDPTGFPAQYTDVGGAPPATKTVWSRAILRHVSGGQASLSCGDGRRRWYSQGTFYVQVFGPIGDGSTAAYDAATIVANAYRGARSDLVWFRNPRINEVGRSGSFEQINFATEFYYDFIQ